jgi:FtsH-binding integral membrane protein
METFQALLMVAFILKFMDALKYARANDWNAVGTQLFTWLAGIVGVMLFAHTAFADGIKPFDGLPTLADMNFMTQLVFGLTAASGASTLADLRKTFDNSQSARVPNLLTGTKTVYVPDPPGN